MRANKECEKAGNGKEKENNQWVGKAEEKETITSIEFSLLILTLSFWDRTATFSVLVCIGVVVVLIFPFDVQFLRFKKPKLKEEILDRVIS